MTAKDMFEELGFECKPNEKGRMIEYRKSDQKTEFGDHDVHLIVFNYGLFKGWFYALWINIYDEEGNVKDKDYMIPLFDKELSKAINKQLEELGWLDD